MKKFLILCSFACLLNFTAYAQDNTQYKSALLKMMVASGSESTYKVAITQMIASMKQQQPSVPAAFWDKMSAKFSSSSMTSLLDLLTPVYQKHLTFEDLNALTAFYESPIGKKFAQKTPLIMQESMQIGQQWGTKMAQEIIEELKKASN